MEKIRIVWIDLAKVLCIYLMIMGHKNLMSDEWTNFIFTFHMPFFFVISGMFWCPISFKETCLKNFKTLIIPFLIMTFIWCLYFLACNIKCGQPICQIVPYILGAFVSPGKDFLFMHPVCIYLWFLIALAIIRLFCSLIHHKFFLTLLSSILLIIDIFFSVNGVVLPFALDSAMLALPFFVIGFLTSSFLTKPHPVYRGMIVVVFSVFVFIIFGNNGAVDINNNLFGRSVFFYLILGCCGTIMILSISRMLSEIMLKPAIYDRFGKIIFNFINVFKNGLLLVVGFSAILTSYYRAIITSLLPSLNINNNLFGLILGGTVWISFYPLTIFCQRFFPAILGFRK